MTTQKIILVLSVAANVALALALYSYADSYASLLAWSCEQGNGGYECGED